jgi:uncharacterized Zn finger protein (UPF0148 family)
MNTKVFNLWIVAFLNILMLTRGQRMLQMKCPDCEGIISSPFLVEMGSISCDQCNGNVTVKDVVVTTKYFTMHRDSLLNRVRHYRALLDDVDREKKSLGKNVDSPTVAYQSLDQYQAALRELLEASRANYRLEISQDLPFDIEWEGSKGDGSLLNLSTKGAAVKLKRLQRVPQKGSVAELIFSLPGITESLSMAAKIAWINKREKDEEHHNITMGVSFINLNPKNSTYIWDYILARTRAPDALGKSSQLLATS